jgi:large subunit ribosomal protein L6
MSNIGHQKVFISSNIKLKIFKKFILIFGLFGNLKLNCELPLKVSKNKNMISFYPLIDYQKNYKLKSMWGTFRMHFLKSTYGLANNYYSFLSLIGVGFKVLKKKNKLILRLGLSHQVFLKLPFNKVYIKKISKRPLLFSFSSPDYDLLQNITFFLRSFKKPEIYKGKGFSFKKELLVLKEGKKVKN